jgi:hypothetical protein
MMLKKPPERQRTSSRHADEGTRESGLGFTSTMSRGSGSLASKPLDHMAQRPESGQAGPSRQAGRAEANHRQSPRPADEQEEHDCSDGSGFGDGDFDDFTADFQEFDEPEDIWDDE